MTNVSQHWSGLRAKLKQKGNLGYEDYVTKPRKTGWATPTPAYKTVTHPSAEGKQICRE